MVTPYNIDPSILPIPDILTMPSYASIKEQNIAILEELKENSYLPLEDDDILLIVEAFAYRELHLRAMVNLKVKNMMPHYAIGADLDNFIWGFYGGITRLEGAYPYVDFRFTLLEDRELTIPDGAILTNVAGDRGRLMQSITLKGIDSIAVARVELLEEVESSDKELIKLEEYPNVKVEQIGLFVNGAVKESDERFLERAILSLNRPSTAGSLNSYYYHILNADVRVDTAFVYSPALGVVRVILDNFDKKIDDLVLERIREILNSDEIKPLTDKIEVQRAETVPITIEVEAKLYDLMQQREIDERIKANFEEPFKIAQSLTFSDLIRRLHVEGVYSVRCKNISDDIVVDNLSRLVIEGVNCVYTQR